MVIILISVALLIAGIVFARGVDDLGPLWEAGVWIGIVGAVVLFLSIIVLPLNRAEGRNLCIEYQQNEILIGMALSNNVMTSEERTNAINIATTTNYKIMKNREWRDNPFIGWFVYGKYGDLALFDISEIDQANTVITVK